MRRGRRARTEARLENMIFGRSSTPWSTSKLSGCLLIALFAYTQLLATLRSNRRVARVLQSRSPSCEVFSRARSRTAAFALFRTVGHLSRGQTRERQRERPRSRTYHARRSRAAVVGRVDLSTSIYQDARGPVKNGRHSGQVGEGQHTCVEIDFRRRRRDDDVPRRCLLPRS